MAKSRPRLWLIHSVRTLPKCRVVLVSILKHPALDLRERQKVVNRCHGCRFSLLLLPAWRSLVPCSRRRELGPQERESGASILHEGNPQDSKPRLSPVSAQWLSAGAGPEVACHPFSSWVRRTGKRSEQTQGLWATKARLRGHGHAFYHRLAPNSREILVGS